MPGKKSRTNGYFVIAGMLLLLFAFLSKNEDKGTPTSRKISGELSKDMELVKGRRNPFEYKFWMEGFENQFAILDGTISRDKRSLLKKLKGGEKVQLLISATDFAKLGISKENITVREMIWNDNYLLSQSEFQQNRSLYTHRVFIILGFGGLMLVLNGIVRVPRKVNFGIIALFSGVVLLMRILEFGMY